MTLTRRPVLALGLAGALLVAGCGSAKDNTDSFSGEERKVAQTVEDFQETAQKKDEGELCGRFLASALVDEIEAFGKKRGESCADHLEKSLRDVDTFDVEVQKVAITGTKATVTIKSENGDDDRLDTLQMVKEQGRWKLLTIGA